MGISTHVLDTSLGRPAADIPISLERQSPTGDWLLVATGETDADGRCKNLTDGGDHLPPGVYRIRFDTGGYFRRLRVEGLYPQVIVIFLVGDASADYHLPLLLSPNSYTTYRGS